MAAATVGSGNRMESVPRAVATGQSRTWT